MQALINEGKAEDLQTIAKWTNMKYSRACQIMNFLILSTAIQEEIICSDDEKLFKIPEYKIREVLQELIWKEQMKKWKELLG